MTYCYCHSYTGLNAQESSSEYSDDEYSNDFEIEEEKLENDEYSDYQYFDYEYYEEEELDNDGYKPFVAEDRLCFKCNLIEDGIQYEQVFVCWECIEINIGWYKLEENMLQMYPLEPNVIVDFFNGKEIYVPCLDCLINGYELTGNENGCSNEHDDYVKSFDEIPALARKILS